MFQKLFWGDEIVPQESQPYIPRKTSNSRVVNIDFVSVWNWNKKKKIPKRRGVDIVTLIALIALTRCKYKGQIFISIFSLIIAKI